MNISTVGFFVNDALTVCRLNLPMYNLHIAKGEKQEDEMGNVAIWSVKVRGIAQGAR